MCFCSVPEIPDTSWNLVLSSPHLITARFKSVRVSGGLVCIHTVVILQASKFTTRCPLGEIRTSLCYKHRASIGKVKAYPCCTAIL